MEELQARILIVNVKGATIAYLYNRESFDLLKIEKQKDDNSQFVEVGQIIEFEDRKYKVDHFNFKMEEKLWNMSHGKGINMYSPTEPTDFNCQMAIFVESVK